MADKSGSPTLNDSTTVRRRQLPSVNGPLIDSDGTPKSVTRRFTTPGSSPLNIRKNTRSSKAKYGGTTDDGLDSTDDEYFAHPLDPKQSKKNNKTKKKSDTTLDKTIEAQKSKSQVAGTSRMSDSQLVVGARKSFETENYNMISKLLNDQTERLEKQIVQSRNSILNTMEEKMENILEESERRMMNKIQTMEVTINERFESVNKRMNEFEASEILTQAMERRINDFSTVVNDQMDQITSRIEANVQLIQENNERITNAPALNNVCPNEGRMTRCEGNIDNVGQEQKNFSLILSGLRPEYQNVAGAVGFAREILGVYLDPNEIADVVKMGTNKQHLTVSKVIFYSVGSKLKIYQARTALRGQNAGVFMNEDLTKERELLNYMTRILFKNSCIAKNWTFLGRIYLKKTLEGEVREITCKDDLKQYDEKEVLMKMKLF